jgi:DNA polymerase
MFNVPIEEITKESPLRDRGKIAELALSYGGGVGALKQMGALDMGLNENELQPLVTAWRNSNPNITNFWRSVDRMAKQAIEEKTVCATHGITFSCEKGMMFITLPSGRRLAYIKPRIAINEKGYECMKYDGVTDSKKWGVIETYGAKLVENIVQAVSRDILTHAMQTLRDCFIVCHVHDEIVIEAGRHISPDMVCEQMSRTPSWAKGLILDAAGFECEFYQKD